MEKHNGNKNFDEGKIKGGSADKGSENVLSKHAPDADAYIKEKFEKLNPFKVKDEANDA